MNQGSIKSTSVLEGIDAPRAGPRSAAPSGSSKFDAQTIKIGGSVVALLVAGVILGWQLFGGPPSTEEESLRRPAVDAVTGEVFPDFRIPKTGTYPWKNPKTGANTLFPAEKCYWTKDGKAKTEPTYVLLNVFTGKPGDAICPDCGRKVVPHNPMPPMKLLNEAFGIKDDESAPDGGK